MKRLIFLVGSLFLLLSVSAQTVEIKGKVTLFNSFPAANIHVEAKKAKSTALTDANGYFTITCKKKDVVQIQEKGFLTASQNVNDKSDSLHINIVFKDSPKNRDLVVSRGNITNTDLLYGLANLKAENNDYCSYENVFVLIRSKFPEVEVKNTSAGDPGVYLRRGQKSLVQDAPMLYIVDGMRTVNISYISPCEIAQILMLSEGKAAKYGAGSSNGAVEITTKRATVN